MSIYIGADSPVYCEDGPTQDTAAIAKKTKSASQAANIYQDSGGPNLMKKPDILDVIVAKASPFLYPVGGIFVIIGMTKFQFSKAVGPISNAEYSKALWTNTANFVGISGVLYSAYAGSVYLSNTYGIAIPKVGVEPHNLPNLTRPTLARPVSMVEKEDLASKFREASQDEATKASNIDSDMDINSIDRKWIALSILEEGEGTNFNFKELILTFFADWLKANHSNVLPSDLHNNLLDYFSTGLSFTGINILVTFMYTAGCYLLFLFLTLLSLNYISSKFTSWTGVASTYKADKSVTQVINSVIKLFILILLFIILVCSAYLYFYCNISQDISHYINEAIKQEANQSTDITVKHKFFGGYTVTSQKLWEIVLLLLLGINRTTYLIKPLMSDGKTKANILLSSALFIKCITAYLIISVVVMIPEEGTTNVFTLVNIFARYNECYKLVFYSTIFFLISNVVVYVINYYHKDKITVGKFINDSEKEIAASSKNYLFINILIVYAKLGSYVAFFGMFQGILFLKGYSIPPIVNSYLPYV